MVEDPDEDSTIEIEIDKVKTSLGIDKPNANMTDDEIKIVVRKFGERGSDFKHNENGEDVYGPQTTSLMLLATLYCFPKYYEKSELSQPQ